MHTSSLDGWMSPAVTDILPADKPSHQSYQLGDLAPYSRGKLSSNADLLYDLVNGQAQLAIIVQQQCL